jgi:4'-phosphopantetheinyl transferase
MGILSAAAGHPPSDVVLRLASLAQAGEFAGWLTPAENAQAARLADAALRARFVVSRGLRRQVLSGCIGAAAGDLVFIEQDGGKPRLAGNHGWDFNLSHTGEHVAVAARRGPVGIDLEQHREVREEEAIVRRYFHPDEAQAWLRLPEDGRTAAFFVLWSAREAAMKCAGLGLAQGIAMTRIDPALLATGTAEGRVGDIPMTISVLDAPGNCTLALATAAAFNPTDFPEKAGDT